MQWWIEGRTISGANGSDAGRPGSDGGKHEREGATLAHPGHQLDAAADDGLTITYLPMNVQQRVPAPAQ